MNALFPDTTLLTVQQYEEAPEAEETVAPLSQSSSNASQLRRLETIEDEDFGTPAKRPRMEEPVDEDVHMEETLIQPAVAAPTEEAPVEEVPMEVDEEPILGAPSPTNEQESEEVARHKTEIYARIARGVEVNRVEAAPPVIPPATPAMDDDDDIVYLGVMPRDSRMRNVPNTPRIKPEVKVSIGVDQSGNMKQMRIESCSGGDTNNVAGGGKSAVRQHNTRCEAAAAIVCDATHRRSLDTRYTLFACIQSRSRARATRTAGAANATDTRDADNAACNALAHSVACTLCHVECTQQGEAHSSLHAKRQLTAKLVSACVRAAYDVREAA